MGRVQDKIAIVTGGGTGIGRASAKRMAEEGAIVTVTDIHRERGEAVAKEIGASSVFITHDVREENDWRALMADVLSRHGRLDILVNNAGILATEDRQSIEDVDMAQWRAIHAVNVDGVYLGCRYGVQTMKNTGGAIVNLSSVAAMVGTPSLAAYGASKGAIRQLTKSVAIDCARKGYGIRCNSVHPGVIETNMGNQAMGMNGADLQESWRARIALIPLGEPGQPEDIANSVLFLASAEARHITGTELVVDGGMTAI